MKRLCLKMTPLFLKKLKWLNKIIYHFNAWTVSYRKWIHKKIKKSAAPWYGSVCSCLLAVHLCSPFNGLVHFRQGPCNKAFLLLGFRLLKQSKFQDHIPFCIPGIDWHSTKAGQYPCKHGDNDEDEEDKQSLRVFPAHHHRLRAKWEGKEPNMLALLT